MSESSDNPATANEKSVPGKTSSTADMDAMKDKKNSSSPSSGSAVSKAIKLLFYFILLTGLGAICYQVYQQDKAVSVLFEQQNNFNTQRNDAGAEINQLQSSVQALTNAMTGLGSQLEVVKQDTSAQIQMQVDELAQQQKAEIDRLQNELVSTRLRISSSNSGASQQWLLAEAASLLRLAQQQLILARSVRTAQALFIAADDVLKQIDDPAIFSVREILACELAAMRAVPEVDAQDIYLQLGAVSNQLAGLQVSNDLATQLGDGDRVTIFNGSENAETGVLSGIFNSMKNLLNRFLVVRRRDEPIQALMTPGQEAALLQTVRLQIEQGRTALLKEEQEIYSGSLAQARASIDQYLAGEPALKASILSTLDELIGRRIVTEPPSLVRTRLALEQILLSAEQQTSEATSRQ